MDDNLKAIMTDKLGQLMMANSELAAANVTLSQALNASSEENSALKTELEMMKQTWTKPADG